MTKRNRDRLFSWMPTTVIGDENDLVVLELKDQWLSNAVPVSCQPSELIRLSLKDVASHHTVGELCKEYLSGEAEREGIQLELGIYVSEWEEWTNIQRRILDIEAARILLESIGISDDLKTKRLDGYTWLEVIQVARNAKVRIRKRPKPIEVLLGNIRSFSTNVAGVSDCSSYSVAVNIQWIQSLIGKDPTANPDTRSLIDAAMVEGETSPWQPCLDQSPAAAEALKKMASDFPHAYTEELTPISVAHILRMVMNAKDLSLDVTEFLGTVRELMRSDQSAPARIACVAVSAALGPPISRRLAEEVTSLVNSAL